MSGFLPIGDSQAAFKLSAEVWEQVKDVIPGADETSFRTGFSAGVTAVIVSLNEGDKQQYLSAIHTIAEMSLKLAKPKHG